MEALDKIEADIISIRKQFPILDQKVNGKPLIYFDNGATTQKPKQVIDKIVDYAEHNILSESEASFNLTIFYGKDANWTDVVNH